MNSFLGFFQGRYLAISIGMFSGDFSIYSCFGDSSRNYFWGFLIKIFLGISPGILFNDCSSISVIKTKKTSGGLSERSPGRFAPARKCSILLRKCAPEFAYWCAFSLRFSYHPNCPCSVA